MKYLFLIVIPSSIFILTFFFNRKRLINFNAVSLTIIFSFLLIFLYSIILGVLINATNLSKYFHNDQYPSLMLSKIFSTLIVMSIIVYLFFKYMTKNKRH